MRALIEFMCQLARDKAHVACFRAVYIAEAHATDEWWVRFNAPGAALCGQPGGGGREKGPIQAVPECRLHSILSIQALQMTRLGRLM